jgi:hypothetical protein
MLTSYITILLLLLPAALLFHSIKPSGGFEKRSMHGACPVIRGKEGPHNACNIEAARLQHIHITSV